MQVTVHPFTSPNDIQRQHYPPTPTSPCHRSNPSSRRASMVLPATLLSRNKSTKSQREHRASISTLSSTKPKPRRLIGDYYVGKTLGKGASGRVKLGVHRHTGEQVAIKIISKSYLAANPAIEKAVRREVAIMKLIHHPNVMGLVDVIDDENSSDLHLILEFVEGGELFEYLVSKGRLSENEARHHFQQIILGLDYCHRHLICHRDLKPENLLLGRDHNVKIADFGMASLQPTGSMLETSCGSPHYASPEIVAGMPYNGSASDIWSCGVILYALLTGHLPFDDDNIRQLLKKVKLGKYTMPDTISRKAQDLLRRILVVDPSKRITMSEIMAHPWFCETKPANLAAMPVPPSPEDIGRPVNDPSEIDDRILETLKFLWGESSDEVMTNQLLSKEANMQKVVYVLLKQHAERYWQTDHADDQDSDSDDETLDVSPGVRRSRYRTIGHRPERDRRCLSMTDHVRKSSHRPVAPWMPEPPKNASRRYSAAVVHPERVDDEMMYQRLAMPPLDVHQVTEKFAPVPIKKSQTFYERFVKGVLSPSRRQSKDRTSKVVNPAITASSPSPVAAQAILTGTLRNKNPFTKIHDNDAPAASSRRASKTPVPPPKSTLRQPEPPLPQRPEAARPTSPTSPSTPSSPPSDVRRSIINPKRLSIRVSQAFLGDDKRRGLFTIGASGQSGNRRQRKELDLSVFDPLEDNHSDLLPPPALSDGSTLSSSSTSSCSSHGSAQHPHPCNALDCSTPTSPSHPLHPVSEPASPRRRGSLASFLTFDRRGSDQSTVTHRAVTPSLLSHSSTITTTSAHSPVTPNQPYQAKPSWLSHLFFFKQPKTCSLNVPASKSQDILLHLHRVLTKVAETRFYEKSDRHGTRYKVDIVSNAKGAKPRHVKCRMEFIRASVDQTHTRVQFTQQQGDGVLLTTVIQQAEALLQQDNFLASTCSKD